MNKKKAVDYISLLVGIVESIVLFIFGILIVSLKNSPNNVFNIVVGIVLIIVSIITLVADIVKEKTVMTENTATSIAMVSIAVLAFYDKAIPVERYIAYFIITFGGYLIIELILSLIFKRNTTKAVIAGVAGLGMIALGISFLTNDKVRDVIYIISGVILIIVSIALFAENLLALLLYKKVNGTSKVVKEKDKGAIDVEVTVINEDVNKENNNQE